VNCVPDAGGEAEIERGGVTTLVSVLADRYRVMLDEALPELDAPGTSAFAVHDSQGPSRSLFARVLDPGIIPRVDMMVPLRSHRDVQVMRPVEWGVIAFPPRNRNAFAVVFERPVGGPLVAPGATAFAPVAVTELTERILAPAADVLANLGRRSLTHGAVRPDNLFSAGAGHLLIGECVTSTPWSAQPAAFVTIEQAMTPPFGRGVGTHAEDMYALGVTLVALALGRIPMAGLSIEEIIEAKLTRGSFIALLGGERVPFGLREVLRGLLADNARERWGPAEVEQWLGGGMNKSLHDSFARRMDRPVVFGGKEHWNFRNLAHGFGADWRAASATVLDDSFGKWMTRGLGDADLADELTKALKAARISGASNSAPDAKLVAQICCILDPDGPMRYRGIVSMPDGLGPLLAAAMRANAREQVSDICDLVTKGLVIDWLTWRGEGDTSALSGAFKPYKELQQLLRHAGPGYGVERCLYELNPHLPCQSQAVESCYVESIRDLLPTLEDVVARTGGLPAVFDRHFAAFIASHSKRNLDRDFQALEEARGDAVLAKLGMVKLFALLQAEHGPPSLPRLTAWLAADLEGAVERFASRTIRAEVRRRLDAAAPQGDLGALYNALYDSVLVARDQRGRRAAVHEFLAARRRISELEGRDNAEGAHAVAGRLASWLGGAAALGSIVLVIMG
jgi:hypothetical protein